MRRPGPNPERRRAPRATPVHARPTAPPHIGVAAHSSAIRRDQLVDDEPARLVDVRAQNLDAFAVDIRPRGGLRRIGPHRARDPLRRPAPIDEQIVAFDEPRQRRLAALRRPAQLAGVGRFQGLAQQVGTGLRETIVQLAVGLVCPQRDFPRDDDVARIHARVHQHDRNAGRALAVQDRALNRRRAAIFRQQRRVHVERAQRRQREQLRRQNAPVRREDEQIEAFAGDLRRKGAQPRRLVDAQAELERRGFDRTRRDAMPAAGRTVGLRDDAAHCVRCATTRRLGTAKALVPKKSVFKPLRLLSPLR